MLEIKSPLASNSCFKLQQGRQPQGDDDSPQGALPWSPLGAQPPDPLQSHAPRARHRRVAKGVD
jgi:hypothetical protein